jgi:hypothetical protein
VVAYCSSPAQLLLVLNARQIDFMDAAGNYRVASFELTFPETRELLSAEPARDGSYDSSRWFGPRVVTIVGSIVPTPSASRGKALDGLMYFLDQSARPVLYYQVDADQPQRVIGLRAAALSAPYTSPQVSAFTLSWKAPDPLSYSAAQSTASVGPGASATVTPAGNIRAWPAFRIHGPCTNPVIRVTTAPTGAFAMVFTTIAAGHYVDAAMDTHVVEDDTGANLYNLVDQTQTTWPSLAPAANTVTFVAGGTGTGTGVDITWRDSYL